MGRESLGVLEPWSPSLGSRLLGSFGLHHVTFPRPLLGFSVRSAVSKQAEQHSSSPSSGFDSESTHLCPQQEAETESLAPQVTERAADTNQILQKQKH